MHSSSSHLSKVNDTYRDFQLNRILEIKELQCVLRELTHLPTGAQVMHLGNNDPENLFCLSFQTLPSSSNGVAHILEHTVLCGSKKFPIKDPFFSMTRRSLNTFMNALTGSDFTCYPASSQVEKDYFNLLDVYLDAVFHPNLNKYSFLQEGHRLEFSNPEDPNSPLEHKGIVFNEMKGALASGQARLSEEMNHALYPNITYGFNAGGEPSVIPELSYEELLQFHETFYHPSRCLFFFYGNLPLEKNLDFIAQHALKDVKKAEPLPELPLQPRFTAPQYFDKEYPIAPDESTLDKTFIAFGWLTCHILDQQEVLALSLLATVLMDNDASLLKHALLKSGLCKQASISMDTDITEVPVVITITGTEPQNADALEEILFDTLKKVVKEGISLESLENAMHRLELARSEITGNHTPFGLSLFLRSALLKQHGGEPEQGLKIHSLFEALHNVLLSNPDYFTQLIKKYFIENTHFVRIVMNPSKELAEIELKDELAGLERTKEKLSSEEILSIVEQTKELAHFQKNQEEKDADSILPKITLKDVPKEGVEYPLIIEKAGNFDVYHHNCFTNGILYADIVMDLPSLQEKDLPLLRLLTVLAPQMGCGGRSYAENLNYIQAHTGGIGLSLSLNKQVTDFRSYSPNISIRGKALHRKIHKLFPLLKDFLLSLDFKDTARVKEVFLKHYISLRESINHNALKYSIALSASGHDAPSKISNLWYGLDYFHFIEKIFLNIDTELPNLIDQIILLQNHVLKPHKPHLIISADSRMYDELRGNHFYGLTDLTIFPFSNWENTIKLEPVASQGRIIASPVAFTSHAIKTVPYVHPDAASLTIASSLFDNTTLHTKIREQGGAYGGGTLCNPLSGSFVFFGYRDPNISSTLLAFENAIENIMNHKFTEQDLEEAKLEVIQNLDAPVAPGSRADLAFTRLWEGKTEEIRQYFRNHLLSATSEHVIAAVKKHIEPQFNKGTTVVFAGKDLLERENKTLISNQKKPLKIETI